MSKLYLRHSEKEGTWYAGRTGYDDHHKRSDSTKSGKFAVGMDGKELVVDVPDGEMNYVESEAIQAVIGIVGDRHVHNRKQRSRPVTGIRIDEDIFPDIKRRRSH